LVALLALPAGACVDYLNHRDSVTLAAGDAMHANAAVQTINPWPYASREKSILYDGQAANRAINSDAYTNQTPASGCVANCTNVSLGSPAGAGAPMQ
jgi:hypothetical protein